MTRRCDADELELGGGLEVLVQASLEGVPAGEILEVSVSSRSVAHELPAWARIAGHETVDERTEGRGGHTHYVVAIRKARTDRVLAPELPPQSAGLRIRRDGGVHTADLRGGETAPDHADPARGLYPVGAIPERGGPDYQWRLSDRDAMWTREVADLAESASGAQWDATVSVPWEAARGLAPDIERAVAQVMTFIAANEYAALYVPAGFLPAVNPEYAEILMWLSSHIHDEARHVEVFTKRALLGGFRGYSLVSTELSLKTLLDQRDFTAAALLLNILGEGTFIDLLRFVGIHGPDAATRTAAQLAERDEHRHVAFGISHVRHSLGQDPERRRALIAAVERRAARLVSLEGISPILVESLTVMAAGSLQRADLARGGSAVKELVAVMHENRVRRLRAAGFMEDEALKMSDLHTPNLM